ncbi:MAG: DUF4133 domain-containing protein [Puia sp.]|nr:DUF4133 domain-containing protein [Puia sp.]
MANNIYRVNKGVNKSIEFKGLRAQYIWFLGGGVVGILVLFAIMYIAGVNQFICIIVAFGSGSAMMITVFRMSHQFGEHGFMKWQAKRNIPPYLRSKSRKHFQRNA